MVRKYEYLTEELNDIEEILSSIDGTFKTTIIDNGYTFKNYNEEVLTGETSDKVSDEINNTLPPKFKKLFRKMVVKCHPDKLGEGDDKTNTTNIYDKVIIAQKK